MFYALIGEDAPGSLEARMASRPAHLARHEALRDEGRLLAAGPMLVLTIWLGGTVFGDEAIRQIVAAALPRLLPPSAGIATQLDTMLARTGGRKFRFDEEES